MGVSKRITMYSSQRVSKMFSALLILISFYRVSCRFIQGERTPHCKNQASSGDFVEPQTVEHTASEGNKVLYTFEANMEAGHVNLCITITGSEEKIESRVGPSDVFIYLSTSNVLHITAYITSSMGFTPKPQASLQEVDEKYVCYFTANNFGEGQGCNSRSRREPARKPAFTDEPNQQWCKNHVEENPESPKIMLNETHEVVIRFEFCVPYHYLELIVEVEDGNQLEPTPYKLELSTPSHSHGLLWICNSKCKMTFQSGNREVFIKSITVSRIVECSEGTMAWIPMNNVNETSLAPSTSMGDTTSHLPSITMTETSSYSSTRMTPETTSQAPSTRTEETTSQAPTARTEGIFQTTTEFDSTVNTTTRTISDGTPAVFQTSTEMQPQDFDYIIVGFGGFGLLLAVVIFSLVCLLLKTRQTLSKKDKKNSAKARELSNSAIENVNNPAHESTEDVRCFPNLDNPEVIYNPAYESSDNVMMSDRKKFEDQKNLPKKSSISSASDVREEIYNPAYETSANVNGTNHLYHYVEHGTNECQIKTRHLPAESQYHYVDFKGK